MSSPPSLPDDPRLAEIAQTLEQTRSAAALCDAQWRLAWVSEEMKVLLDEPDEDKLGYGKHVLEAYLSDTWALRITQETQARMFMEHFPRLIADTPGGRERMSEIFRAALARWREQGTSTDLSDLEAIEVFEHIQEVTPPTVWVGRIEFLQGDLPPLEVVETAVRLRDESGDLMGTAIMYHSGLPARVLSLVARGDERMFSRMLRLFEPDRRRAAILFADLQDSAVLSRKLSSAAYFKLVRALTTAIDDVVVERKGVVGKHAGDGATAFFLAGDLGSDSNAAKVAIQAARDICVAARDAAKEVGEETGLIDPDECLVNVGLHWGGALYMGQLVTGGRLEVTAIGDEVNECARIQQSARDGAILASKMLVERLTGEDAASLGIDADQMLYQTVGELPGVSAKAARDAGSIPVAGL
jgi:class 3 adenylate cyclase